MKPVYDFLDGANRLMRGVLQPVAVTLNRLSGGRLTPDMLTLTGLVMHLPTAWLIGIGYYGYAGLLLVVFGLFDALDGALARLQKRDSPRGMLLDSVTDRVKEVMLYAGAAYSLAVSGQTEVVHWAVIACGASLVVSYVNAWGEVIVSSSKRHNAVNQAFRSGLARFEVRMFLLVLGLLFSRLAWAVIIIAILASFTVFERLVKVSRSI